MGKKILVYNNSTGIMEKMVPLFATEGLDTIAVSNSEQLCQTLKAQDFALVLVDIELNHTGWDKGIEMIASLRKTTPIPLFVVSAQSAETAKIMALEAGADDYVTADCHPLVLLARIKSQLRRYTQLVNMCSPIDRTYRVDGLVIDDNQQIVTVEGNNVRLTPIEYKILRLLVQQRGQVLSISQIYENIWHMRAIGAENTIAVHIRHIREKIENNPREPKYLKAVWGYGYKVI